MKQSFQEHIDNYISNLSEIEKLEIIDENFSNETIFNQPYLFSSTFRNLNLQNINFTNVNLRSSLFYNCSFTNCSFKKNRFEYIEFLDCKMVNCNIRDCNLSNSSFIEITFDNCLFERMDSGSLIEGWFESCHFVDIIGFRQELLTYTALVNSKFSKLKHEVYKCIDFDGEFSFVDIFYSQNGLDGMFI